MSVVSGVSVSLATGTGTGGDAQGDVFSGFSGIDGSNINDSLTGDANNNYLNGGNGDDTIEGGLGACRSGSILSGTFLPASRAR